MSGYRATPDDDRRRAQVFFDRGKTVADTGNYEYAIEMYLQGLSIDPENIDAHQALRDISLKRKVSGGKDMGMIEKMKMPKAKDEKQTVLNNEKLLAYDPGNTDRMLALFQSAHKAGFYDTVIWIGAILQRANQDAKRPDFHKFIVMRDVFDALGEYQRATEAAHFAMTLRPNDMTLQHVMKELAAKETMSKGKYGVAKTFRESMRDQELQDRLLEQEKDVRAVDALQKAIDDAEAAWQADPADPAKFLKLLDALRRPENDASDERAIALLEQAYENGKQFKWRQRIGELRMGQLARQERAMRADLEGRKEDPDYADLVKQFKEFRTQKTHAELQEFQLILENYPTDSNARFQVAVRMFQLGQFQESIPVFQHARNDPKYRVAASIYLGQAFLQAGFADEAVDTLKAVIDEYPGRGDDRSREMYYWYARSLEEKKDFPASLKAYSQVAQWDFNYRDVQGRIKRLRAS